MLRDASVVRIEGDRYEVARRGGGRAYDVTIGRADIDYYGRWVVDYSRADEKVMWVAWREVDARHYELLDADGAVAYRLSKSAPFRWTDGDGRTWREATVTGYDEAAEEGEEIGVSYTLGFVPPRGLAR